jgi:hypothetical protein
MKLGCPLNQSEYLVEIKNCIYLQGIWPGLCGPAPGHYSSHSYIYIIFVFVWLLCTLTCRKD